MDCMHKVSFTMKLIKDYFFIFFKNMDCEETHALQIYSSIIFEISNMR